ncbi:WGR domain-containing protein [Komagataeibacter xylinus]|uniref:WGR domain-containing protein n=1 Tax=Komagataeibacter xylinus TaxID=28448 RepID=UPI001F5F63DB|nr:WGR domain-containing protein [Komagataeibacter xylinus]
MPRPAPKAPVPPPRQLSLFPETAALVRQWGRIGTAGRQVCELHHDAGQARDALARQLRAKRRRGYRDRAAG